jgi:pimeloyl-ACP methyl ester carboxylesterase
MPYMHVGKEHSGATEFYYKAWGSGQPVVFSHGWPLRHVSERTRRPSP